MTRKLTIPNDAKSRRTRVWKGTRLLFTDRERTILLLMIDGMSNQEIAEHLTLSPTTVKWYVKQIFNKLGVNRRTQAVKLVSDLRLLEIKSSEYSHTSGIPIPLTALIGREREVKEINNLLNDSTVRLVTILGVGGIGKTRLALDVAQQQAQLFPGQVCYIALDSITSLQGMIQAIASAIGFQFHGSLDLGRQLLTNLRNRKLVLVLDNFEQLLESTPFVREMLAAAPRLRILTTSRERLNLSVETVYTLRGLDYPLNIENADNYPALILFMQSAHYSQPTFHPDSKDVFYICQICQLAEGMPLAIELAAHWIDLLTPLQIAEEIVKSIGILHTTWKDLPERHRNIRAVFERSWQLLSDEVREVFKKLCVFLGGIERAAAEWVAGATLFTLSTLVDKSLLIRVGQDRFKLHELVRQFAKEKLQTDVHEYRLILHKHCQYYASLMERWEQKIKTDVSALPNSLLGVNNDYDNILAGWHCALTVPLIVEIKKYVFIISLFFAARGLNTEAERTLAQALRLFETLDLPTSAPVRVQLMTHHGWFLLACGQLESACQVLQDARKITPILDDSHAADVGILLGFLSVALHLNGQSDEAREHAKQGLAICQTANFQLGVWICFSVLGEIELKEGRYETAYYYHHKAFNHSEHYRNLYSMIESLGHLGCTCCVWGKVDEARQYLHRGLTLMHTFSTVDTLFLTILGIAGIYEQRGQHVVALELLAILLCHPQYGSPVLEPTVRVLLAQLQSRLSSAQINSVMEKAKQGQLSRRYLDPHFSISPELVDRLFKLLDETARV